MPSQTAQRQHFPDIVEVEQDGAWVSASRSGLKSQIVYWQAKGYLKEGRDFKKVRALVPRSGPRGSLAREVTVYRRAALEKLAGRDWQGSRRKKCQALHEPHKRVAIDGVEHLRIKGAAAYVGVSKSTLREMRELCPKLRVVRGRETAYYPLPDLEKARKEMAGAEAHRDGFVGMEEAVRLTGLSAWTLRDREACSRNGIRFEARDVKGDGRRKVYSFERASLVGYGRKRDPKAQPPAGHLTTSQAAARLRVSQTTIKAWRREGILKAVWGDVAAGHTVKKGWLIAEESVKEAWDVICTRKTLYGPAPEIRELGCQTPSSRPAPPANDGGVAAMPSAESNAAPGATRETLGEVGKPQPYPVTLANVAEVVEAFSGAGRTREAFSGAGIPSEALMSPRAIAEAYDLPQAALDQALRRWRNDNPKESGRGWVEVSDRGSRSPQFLYSIKFVEHIIEAARANALRSPKAR